MNMTNSNADQKELILASASPRRRELLESAGYRVRVMPSPIPEPEELEGVATPVELAEGLSRFKAEHVARFVESGVLLAGDTVVAIDRTLYGKPTDRADARRIIEALAGTTHDVVTGVTLLDIESGRTRVTMRSLSEEEIEAYLDTGAWEGKAGAYGIQDHGDEFVTALEGSFTNVVGLPMELVERMLAAWGISPEGGSERES